MICKCFINIVRRSYKDIIHFILPQVGDGDYREEEM